MKRPNPAFPPVKGLQSLFAFFILSASHIQAQFMTATPPVAPVKAHWRVVQGDSVLDNYYWMYDYFGKGPDSTKAVNYLKAENRYLDTTMRATEKFQAALFDEMKSRIKEKDEQPPVFHRGYFYYTRTDEGKQYYKYCRRKGTMDAKEEILLDLDVLAQGHHYYSATGFNISADNKMLAYGLDTVSRRQYVIYVKNLETGETINEQISNTDGSPKWANDNKTFFYTSKDPVTILSNKIYRHVLGTNSKADQLVFEEKDPSNFIWIDKSKNDKYIFIISWARVLSDTRLIDADRPYDSIRMFQPRIKDVLYDVIAQDDRFLIRTNKDSSGNFKLMECPLDKTGVSNWKEVIPVRKDVLLESVEEFKDFIVLKERKDGLVRFRVIRTKEHGDYYIDFDEPTYYTEIGDNPDYGSSVVRYVYSSMITPVSTFDYNMADKKRKLIKQEVVVGNYDPTEYATERLYATAGDGTRIPMSLVYKKGFKRDGNAPLLIYGYGSYGASSEAGFRSIRLSLLNRGFVYAITHIRGGQEMGRQWYDDGKMMKKKNTFTDFIDCAKFLVKEKYTSPAHLYANGASAGGMLMGAVVNMSPELWHGVVAGVPFVDVVNTMLDENIPLTTNEYDEWGDPKEKAAYFYMKSYTPYENVERKNYPNLLVTTGLHDSQVQYFEPEKWVAKLRAMKTDKNLLLLHTNMDFGHGGASGRFDYLKDYALLYAFLCNLEGIRN